jgi:hypothetical protein
MFTSLEDFVTESVERLAKDLSQDVDPLHVQTLGALEQYGTGNFDWTTRPRES